MLLVEELLVVILPGVGWTLHLLLQSKVTLCSAWAWRTRMMREWGAIIVWAGDLIYFTSAMTRVLYPMLVTRRRLGRHPRV